MNDAVSIATQAEFAKMLGVRSGYITKLKQAGRLVLTPDGRNVIVEASKQRIEETRDPNRSDVVQRNAELREQNRTGSGPTASAAAPAVPPSHDQGVGNTYQAARAVKERYLALQAKREYEQACRLLMESVKVQAMLADAITTLRTNIEALPVTLGPLLAAEQDEARCIALLRENVEHLLTTLANHFRKIHEASHEGE